MAATEATVATTKRTGQKTRPVAGLRLAHSLRFRAVSDNYPRRVAEAYRGHGGIRQAARDSDRQIAKMVAAWERRHGVSPRDWVRHGRTAEGRALETTAVKRALAQAARKRRR